MARRLKTDGALFMATFLLVCTSIVMVYSASSIRAADKFHDEYYYVTRQALWVVLGLALLSIAMRIDYRTYRTDAFAWALVGVVGVMLVAVLFTDPIKGARRWLTFSALRVQPSELAKLTCVIFTALILERRMHRIDEVGYSLARIAIVVGFLVALIWLEHDLGTSVSVLLIVGVMIFSAGLRYQYAIGAALAAAVAIGLVMTLMQYQADRVVKFLHGGSRQAIESQIAVGAGGLLGRGISLGEGKLYWVPEVHNDFIFSVIGEELGLVGTVSILLCFCVIAWRGLRIAARAEEAFGALVAIGITTMICAQAFVNISVTLNLLPTKGIPLPLVSAGGSSLVVSLVSIGVLLNISQHETARV